MADTKISALTSATLPLSGSELVPIVQSGTTVKTAISNIASNQPPTPYTANGVVYASSTSALATGSALTFDGTNFSTTGSATATAFIPSGSTVPTNGMYLPTTNTVALSTNTTERARIDSSGQLHLGNTVPTDGHTSSSTFFVGLTGSVFSERTTGLGILGNHFTDNAYIAQSTGNYAYITTNPASMVRCNQNIIQFSNAASGSAGTALTWSEAMRIDSSGNLLVGTTSFNYANNGVGIRSNAYSYFTATSATPLLINQNGTAGSLIAFNYAGSGVGSISTNGLSTTYNTTSDQRLKENIVDAPEFGSVIDSIQVRSFDWKTNHTHQRAGFIAQELVTVAPEAVHQPVNEEEMMAVDYSKLVPMLVKEIQSLRKRIATLENK